MLRLVFCGTAPFAVPSLEACAASAEVLAVVTQPDRPGDRGRPAERPVADAAERLALPVLRPERIRQAAAVAEIAALGADALVVAAYGQIIPAALLDAHRLGGVNVHASLLPRWRGASPVQHAILHGDAETGVCIMRMEAGLDTGPVYACRSIPLGPDDTAPAVTDRLAALGAALLTEVLAALERGDATATPQPDDGVTLAPRLTREMGRVDWSLHTAAEVDRRVRALQPWPAVTASLGGQDVRILAGAPVDAGTAAAAGTVVASSAAGVDVATADGVYRVVRVQPPGGRAMDAAAYLRGRRIAAP